MELKLIDDGNVEIAPGFRVIFRPPSRADGATALEKAGGWIDSPDGKRRLNLSGEKLFDAIAALIISWTGPDFPPTADNLRRLLLETFSEISSKIFGWEETQLKNSSAVSGLLNSIPKSLGAAVPIAEPGSTTTMGN